MPEANAPHQNLQLRLDHIDFKFTPCYDYLYVDEIQ